MARGHSGRIVLEIDPSLKNELYSILARDGVTLKEWFIDKAEKHIERKNSQLRLNFKDFLQKE